MSLDTLILGRQQRKIHPWAQNETLRHLKDMGKSSKAENNLSQEKINMLFFNTCIYNILPILKAKATEAIWSMLRPLESANCTLLQNDSPVLLFIINIVWVLRTHLRTSNSPITRSIKNICNRGSKIPISENWSIEGQHSLMVMTTDQLLWRQKTYFCGAPKRYSVYDEHPCPFYSIWEFTPRIYWSITIPHWHYSFTT